MEEVMRLYEPLAIKVGDVVTSPYFILGFASSDGVTTVGAKLEEAKNADITRRDAQYVIISTDIADGGSDQNGDYPDYVVVTARRLDSDGKYNSAGETIVFHIAKLRTDSIPEEKIKIVGHLEQYFH